MALARGTLLAMKARTRGRFFRDCPQVEIAVKFSDRSVSSNELANGSSFYAWWQHEGTFRRFIVRYMFTSATASVHMLQSALIDL